MNAVVEELEQDDISRIGNLSDQPCPKHGLHFNPMVSDGCGRCEEEIKQAKQARIALLIVVVVLLAVVTVIAQVTWLWFSGA